MSKYPSNENIQLIWLDNSTCSTQFRSKLLRLNSVTQFHTDPNQCITFIKSIKDEKIILIVSITLVRTILSQIHSNPLLICVFIFSSNDNGNQSNELINEYTKIIRIYFDYELLLESIEQTINIIEQQILSFNLFHQNNDYKNDLSKMSASFLWYQLLIGILKQMPINEQIHKNIFQTYNEVDKNEINQFKKNYTKEKSIELFHEKYFIRKILNKALRTKNIQLIYLFQYFIIDLYDQIQFEKQNFRNQQLLKLYYGQKILKTEFDQFNKHIGCYISPNGFLSVSLNRTKSIELAKADILHDEHQSILFQFEIDPTLEQITLVEIDDRQELIFNIDTVFKINSIEYDSSLQLWIINLFNDDKVRNILQKYFQSIEHFTNENSFLIFFGRLFIELDQLIQSEIYFHILINTLSSNHEAMASIYNQIGNFLADKGQLKLALDNYQHAYQIRQKRLPNHHPHIAVSLNNIGLIYKDQGKFDQALDYCQKALTIDEINYPKDHVLKAMTIENIGGIYKEQRSFSMAQTYLLRALTMYKSVLPSNHYFLTDILNSLGKVYCDQGYYDRALTCYRKAYSISNINYADDHLQKAQTMENIGLLYKTNGMLEEAHVELSTALNMYKRIYPNEHHDIARCFGHIGLVYEAGDHLDFALDYFNKQLDMDEKCLSDDHQNIEIDIQWIIDVYKKKGDLLRAYEFCQKQYKKKVTLLGECHPMTLSIFMSLIDLCNDPVTKSNYFIQALSRYEKLKPFDSLATIKCLNAMIKFYSENNKFEQALNYQIQMINLQRKKLGDDHIDLAISLENLGRFYESVSKLDKAEQCYGESRIIFEKNRDNRRKLMSSPTNNSNSSNNDRDSNFTISNICTLQ